MRTCPILVLLSLLACPAPATLSIDMYASDEETPLALRDPNDPNGTHVYRDIMVGTRLCVIVGSNRGVPTTGALEMSTADLDRGVFVPRDYDAAADNWVGSVYRNAGDAARVWYKCEELWLRSTFQSSGHHMAIGKWFVWDYQAKAVGTCYLGLIDDLSVAGDWRDKPDTPAPDGVGHLTIVTLNHVPTRDFDGDTRVNFKDFALLARQWRTDVNPDPNGVASPFDFDGDAYVKALDLNRFCRFWLDTTDARIWVPDPNTASVPQQP